jgi:hypothetical protein
MRRGPLAVLDLLLSRSSRRPGGQAACSGYDVAASAPDPALKVTAARSLTTVVLR